VVMHGDNHQSTMLRGIRTHVSTFHLQNVWQHSHTRIAPPLDGNLHKSSNWITTRTSNLVTLRPRHRTLGLPFLIKIFVSSSYVKLCIFMILQFGIFYWIRRMAKTRYSYGPI
jgi:hypothetical protein